MIRIKDSLKLASTKFKTRKVRNILSAVTVSLGIILILSALIASNGVTTFAGSVFKDSLQNRFFIRDTGYTNVFEKTETQTIPGNSLADKSAETYLEENRRYAIKSIFEERQSTTLLGFKGQEFSSTGEFYGMGAAAMSSTEELFIKDTLHEGYSFTDSYDGKIPVTVPKDYLFNVEQISDRGSNSREQFEKTQELVKKYIGRTIQFDQYPNTETMPTYFEPGIVESDSGDSKPVTIGREFIIVGVSTPQFFGYSLLDSQFVIPNWAVQKYSDIASVLPAKNKRFIAEFSSKKDGSSFYKDKIQNSSVEIMVSKLESFQEPISVMRKVAFAIGGFLLAISALFILTTLSKIVTDSRREIGVFRAVGGQRRDIKKIFLSYAFLLITLGFLIGFVISLLLTALVSLKWGDSAFYAIVNFGTTVDVQKPFLFFVSLPIIEILVLYAFILLVGFLAAYFPTRRASRIDPIKALREE
jgi:ABC-type antimicrobial peptide transport system permease subunit